MIISAQKKRAMWNSGSNVIWSSTSLDNLLVRNANYMSVSPTPNHRTTSNFFRVINHPQAQWHNSFINTRNHSYSTNNRRNIGCMHSLHFSPWSHLLYTFSTTKSRLTHYQRKRIPVAKTNLPRQMMKVPWLAHVPAVSDETHNQPHGFPLSASWWSRESIASLFSFINHQFNCNDATVALT